MTSFLQQKEYSSLLLKSTFQLLTGRSCLACWELTCTAQSNNNSPRDSPCKENKIKKRKGEEVSREAKKARKTGGLAGSSSDESESESDASDNEESDNESSRFSQVLEMMMTSTHSEMKSSEDDEDDPLISH